MAAFEVFTEAYARSIAAIENLVPAAPQLPARQVLTPFPKVMTMHASSCRRTT